MQNYDAVCERVEWPQWNHSGGHYTDAAEYENGQVLERAACRLCHQQNGQRAFAAAAVQETQVDDWQLLFEVDAQKHH